MWLRLRKDDVKAIVHYLGTLVMVIGALMVAPMVVAFFCREANPLIWFTLSFGITVSIGAAMRLVKPTEPGLTRKQAMIVTGLAWIVGGSATALPMFFSGNFGTYFDALFNAVSYLSGTGMVLVTGLGKLPISISVWRFVMVILGAQGIVMVAMGLGTLSRFTGAESLFQAEGHSDKIMPQMAGTARFTAIVLGVLILTGTLVCTVILIVTSGFSPANALYHGFALATSAVCTGGITIMPTSVMYYHSAGLNFVLAVLMMSGVFSFALYYYMARKGAREFFRDIETRTILIWTASVAVILAIAFSQDGYFADAGIFVDKGLFNLISATTGTGFSTFTSTQLGSVATSAVLFTLILGMLMGGATSSTAGGFKAIRVALLLRAVQSEVRHSLMPASAREAVRFHHFGEQILTPEMSRNAMLVLLLYLVSFAIGAILGVAHGYDPVSAVLESVSCSACCGFSSGIVALGMPVGLKVCYFVQMLAGRLEFLTLFSTIASIGASLGHVVLTSRAVRGLPQLVPIGVRRAWRGQGTSGGERR